MNQHTTPEANPQPSLGDLVNELPREQRLYVLHSLTGFVWTGCTAPEASQSLKEITEDLAAGLAQDRIKPDDALFVVYSRFMSGAE